MSNAPRTRLPEHVYVSPPQWVLVEDSTRVAVEPRFRLSRFEIGCGAAITVVVAPMFALFPALMGDTQFAIFFALFIGLMGPGGLLIAWVMRRASR